MNLLVLYSLLLALQLLILFSHLCGLYLLVCLHKNGRGDVKQLLIMNLSIIEFTMTFCYFILYLLRILELSGEVIINVTVYTYISIAMGSILSFLHYMCMIYITYDEILEVCLHTRYSLYCDVPKTKCLICFTWAVGFVFGVSVMIAYGDIAFEYHETLEYSHLIFDFLFIIIVIVLCGYMLYIYKENTNNLQQSTSRLHPGITLFNVFTCSRFNVSTLLILSFLFFNVFSDLANISILQSMKKTSKSFLATSLVPILHHVSYFADSLIYMFLLTPVKELLYTKFRANILWSRFAENNSDEERDLSIQLTRETSSL